MGGVAQADELEEGACGVAMSLDGLRGIFAHEIQSLIADQVGPVIANLVFAGVSMEVHPGDDPARKDDATILYKMEFHVGLGELSDHIWLVARVRFLGSPPEGLGQEAYPACTDSRMPDELHIPAPTADDFPGVYVESLRWEDVASSTEDLLKSAHVWDLKPLRPCVEAALRVGLDEVLGRGQKVVDDPNDHSNDVYVVVRDVVRLSGGYDQAQSIVVSERGWVYFAIPCVDSTLNTFCTHQTSCDSLDETGDLVLWIGGEPGSQNATAISLDSALGLSEMVDTPKLLSAGLQEQREQAQQIIDSATSDASRDSDEYKNAQAFLALDLHVECNHGMDCSGGQGEPNGDDDGDGYCNDEDFCPNLFTGSNCDQDGDGQGDGALLQQRPGSLYGCVIADALKTRNRLSSETDVSAFCQKLVGGCDMCPFEGPVQGTVSNKDLDGDHIADRCDADWDGDGVVNEMDCAPWNGAVGRDWDRDGWCDDGCAVTQQGVLSDGACSDCREACDKLVQDYDRSYLMCTISCIRDNCMDPDNQHCAAAGECDSGMWTWRCDQAEVDRCADLFGNDQADADGDHLGDKCEDTAVGDLTVEPDLLHEAVYCWGGSLLGGCIDTGTYDYRVSFRTWGSRWQEGQADPGHVLRNDVRVSACNCRAVDDQGRWDSSCDRTDRCPRDGEYRVRSDGRLRTAWNPIDSSDISETDQTNTLKYPVAPGVPYRAQVLTRDLIQYRLFDFNRSDDNRHSFVWQWKDWFRSVQFPAPGQTTDLWRYMGNDYDQGSTVVRVAWFDTREDPDYAKTVFSEPVVMSRHGEAVSGTGPYLMPELIIDRIPGEVERVGQGSVVLPGWLVGRDPASGQTHLYELAKEGMQVAKIWDSGLDLGASVQILASAQAMVPADLVGGAQGAQVPVIALYSTTESGGPSPVAGAGQTAQIYLLVQDGDQAMSALSLEALTGRTVPVLSQPRLLFTEGGTRLLVAGATDSGLMAYRIRLSDGAVASSRPLDLDPGFCWTEEPVTGRVYAFATRSAAGAAPTAALRVIDPVSLSVTDLLPSEPVVAASATAQPPGPRSGCGLVLDRDRKHLYLAGGRSPAGDLLADLWSFDLTEARWAPMASAQDGLAAMERPLISLTADRIWLTDAIGRTTTDGVETTSRALPGGSWITGKVFQLATDMSWPLQDIYGPGRAPGGFYLAPDEAAWPGQVLLATLQTSGSGLGLRVFDSHGLALAQSSASNGTSPVRSGFVCEPGSACLVRVFAERALTQPVSLQVDVQPAYLTTDKAVRVGGRVRDLLVSGPYAFVASDRGVSALDLSDQDLNRLGFAGGCGLAAARALAHCGAYLCLARMGLHGLVVIDAADPATMRKVASTWTAGLGFDIAASGRYSYMAHGWFGLGVYDVTDPLSPTWANQVWPGGRVVSVALGQGLVVAATRRGQVILYRPDGQGGLEELSRFSTRRKLGRVRFKRGLLWVLGKHAAWARAYDVTDPGSPLLVAEGLDKNAVLWVRRRLSGDRAVVYDGTRVMSEHFEVAP